MRPTAAYKRACSTNPHKMPCVIDSVSGISTMVTNAGRLSSVVEKLTLATI